MIDQPDCDKVEGRRGAVPFIMRSSGRHRDPPRLYWRVVHSGGNLRADTRVKTRSRTDAVLLVAGLDSLRRRAGSHPLTLDDARSFSVERRRLQPCCLSWRTIIDNLFKITKIVGKMKVEMTTDAFTGAREIALAWSLFGMVCSVKPAFSQSTRLVSAWSSPRPGRTIGRAAPEDELSQTAGGGPRLWALNSPPARTIPLQFCPRSDRRCGHWRA